jgi:hypothetical protein
MHLTSIIDKLILIEGALNLSQEHLPKNDITVQVKDIIQEAQAACREMKEERLASLEAILKRMSAVRAGQKIPRPPRPVAAPQRKRRVVKKNKAI